MATLKDLREKIEEFSLVFRSDSLPTIEEGRLYSLYEGGNVICDIANLYWPEQWPLSDRRGIYAIFSHERLLYIGKASAQDIGHRLNDYFKAGKNGECVINKNHTWTSEPTHIVTWAVPDQFFYLASGLEEFLIDVFSLELPDNTRGKYARPIR